MSAHAAVWWAVLAAMIVVLGAVVMRLAAAVRALQRCASRLEAYQDLPLAAAAGDADAHMRRIATAVEQVAPLIDRARAALAVIRKGPVPPELVAAIGRVRAEIAAFRAVARR